MATYMSMGWDLDKILTFSCEDNYPHLRAMDVIGIALGDVNTDGVINILDVIDIARYAAGLNPAGFQEEVADVNANGTVNITDAVTLINKIAGDVTAMAKSAGCTEVTSADRLTLVTDGDKTLRVALDNSEAYTACQMDVIVPDGTSIQSVSQDPARTNGHRLLFNKIGENTYRIVVLSLDNAAFRGNTGALLNISLNRASGQAQLRNACFVTTRGQEVDFDAVSLANTTRINGVKTDQQEQREYYNVSGQRVSKPQHGVYIYNGKKSIFK